MSLRSRPLRKVEDRDERRSAVQRLRRRCGAWWTDVDGADMAEWAVIVALVLAVGLTIYNRVLTSELSATVDAIGNHILDAASGNLGGT